MRVVSDELDAEVAGTTVGDRLEVNAWRDGQLLARDLQVTSWDLSWDAGRQVQGQASFTIADPDGSLAPWGVSDALGPGGSRLQVTWVSGISGIRVPLGWWRIRRPDPVETWRVYTIGDAQEVRRVPGGGRVSVAADEETATVVLEGLDAESPAASTTCVAEVRRLLADICPVVALAGVVDGPVPAGLVYDESRMDAVEDLLDAISATYRMGADGSLEVVPAAGIGPVWTIRGGDDGALVRPVRSLSDADLFNAAISYGETADGQPLVGRAYTLSGPLAWGGPFGRVPVRHRAAAQTQSAVNADAAAVLARQAAAGEVVLDVTCLTHPGIQLQDRVTVVAPTVEGDASLTGRVVSMQMGSATSDAGTTPAKAMRLGVAVPAAALEAVAVRVRRGG